MKKNLMIAAAFLVLLASCSKESLETQTAKKTYQFETSIGGLKNTKGISKDTWKMGDVIALYGLDMPIFNMGQAPNQWTFNNSQNAGEDNMTPMINYGVNGQDWRYGAPVAWYDEIVTSFIAVYPYHAPEYTLEARPTTASGIVIDYKVQGGYIDGAADADIASARGQIKKQTDLLVAVTKDVTNTVLEIPLNFRHALSQLRFRIINSSTATTSILRVNDITIEGVNTRGEFNFTGNEENAPVALSQWVGQAEPMNFKVNLLSENVNAIKFGDNVAATDNDDESLIMLPQMVPATATISVTYSFSNDGGQTWVEYVQGTQLDPINLSNIRDRWEPNKRYTFTLAIRPSSPITFFPTVDAWDNENVNLP